MAVQQWSIERAWQWWDEQPWLRGFNYLPRTAVNWTEMWQRETFDLPTIQQELAWAKSVGYNTCLLYTSPSPRDGLLSRMPSSA